MDRNLIWFFASNLSLQNLIRSGQDSTRREPSRDAPMNETVQINLALILFLPWYAILGAMYWFYPRQPRHAVRRLFDAGALIVTTWLSVWAMRWGFLNADTSVGALWKQVLATSVSYGAFLGALSAAALLRWLLILRPARARTAALPASECNQ